MSFTNDLLYALRRLPRRLMVTGILIYCVGIGLYWVNLTNPQFASWMSRHQDSLRSIAFLAAAPFVFFAGPALLRYLNVSSKSFKEPSYGTYDPTPGNTDRRIRELRASIATLTSDMAAMKAIPSYSNAGEARAITSQSLEDIRASLRKELVPELEQKLSKEALAKAQVQEIRSTFANSYTRLANAVEALNRRGNVNLVIGVFTTLLAATVLVYMALKAPTTIVPAEILAHYIPRLSTVIFIEVFSFFFLRLYKATLDDSKFYQLQLLSVSTSDIALQTAMKSGDATVIAATVAQIARGRTDAASEVVSTKPGDLDARGFADLLEKFGKLAVEVSKAKGTAG